MAGPSAVLSTRAHGRDAEYGVVEAVAFEAATAEDLPGLHAAEDALDAGADLLVNRDTGPLSSASTPASSRAARRGARTAADGLVMP